MHIASRAGDVLPDLPAWVGPPDNEVPGALAVAAVLLRGEDAAVALVGGRRYSTGVEVSLVVRARRVQLDADGVPQPLFELVEGGGGRRGRGAGRLILGVELADGRVAVSTAALDARGDDEPRLTQRGSQGGDRGIDQEYWLTPPPPPGDLVIVCAWPALGFGETRTVVPAASLVPVAEPVTLWPREPQVPHEWVEAAPDVEPGGWFDRVLRSRGPVT